MPKSSAKSIEHAAEIEQTGDSFTVLIDESSYADAAHEESIVEVLKATLLYHIDRTRLFHFHVSFERRIERLATSHLVDALLVPVLARRSHVDVGYSPVSR